MHPITERATRKRLLQYQISESVKLVERFEANLKQLGFNPDKNVYLKAMHSGIGKLQAELSDIIAKEVMVNADMYSDNRGFHP